jgi:hypothetical protein
MKSARWPGEEFVALANLSFSELATKAPNVALEFETAVAESRKAAVLAAIVIANPKVVQAIKKATLSAWPSEKGTFTGEVVTALKRTKVARNVLVQAEAVLRGLEARGRLPDPARSTAPLRDHPVTRAAIDQARLSSVAMRAGLTQAKADVLLSEVDGFDTLRTPILDALVANGRLTEDDAGRLTVAAVIARLTGSTAGVIDAVFNLKADTRNEPRVQRASDLATIEPAEWQEIIAVSGLETPPGVPPERFAQVLTERVARVLPTDFLMHRTTAIPPGLRELVATARNRPESEDSAALTRLARRNPGLALQNVLAGNGSAEETAMEIERRIGLSRDVWSGNTGRNLIALDYSVDGSDVESLRGLPTDEDDLRLVLNNLKAFQRAFLVAEDAATAVPLLDAGFDAARKVVALTQQDFQTASGLSEAKSAAVYRNAQELATAAGVKAIAIMRVGQGGRPGVGPMGLQNSGAIADYLVRIPGYDKLFQTAGFCDCEECQSVLGLAAYFVDLMYFVEQQIIDRADTFRNRPNHPLHLKTRRPDLWDLDLSCLNSNEIVAYLDVINEVLEKYLVKRLALPQNGDVWERIAARNASFALPFHWPLERIETYLGHFSKRRLDAALVCRAGEPQQTRARLRLSETEHEMIVTVAAANFAQLTAAESDFLSRLFAGMTVNPNGTVSTSGFGTVFIWQLLKATAASREQIGELLASAFVRGGATFNVRAGRMSAASIQNDTEIVDGMRAEHLDRLHRFQRLARRLPWSVSELDLVFTGLTARGLATGLDDPALRLIARLLRLQERLGLDVIGFAGVWSDLPNQAVGRRTTFFNDLFNPPQFSGFGQAIDYQQIATAFFLHPSFNSSAPPATGTSNPQDNTLARLLSGLRATDQDLVQLLTALAPALGLDPTSPNVANRRLALSVGNLTLLYRHVVLAQRLQRSIPELFQLLDLAGIRNAAGNGTAAFVEGWSLVANALKDDLSTLVDANDWMRRAPFTLDEIAFITSRPVRQPDQLPDIAELTDRVLALVQGERAFGFADTVLSGLPNGPLPLTEAQSREIIALNAVLFDITEGGAALRLKDTVTPEPRAANIQLPTGLATTGADVAERLAAFSVHRLLPGYIATALGVPLAKLEALLRASGQNVTLDSPPFLQSLAALAYGTSVDRSRLTQFLAALVPYAVLYRDEIHDETTIDFIQQHRLAFGQTAGLVTESVRLTSAFQRLVSGPNPAYATSAIGPDPAAVLQVIDQGVATVASTILARALRTDVARVDALRPHLLGQLAGNAIDAVGMLVECLDLIQLLGISGETLKDLALTATTPPPAETEYQRLRRAADGLFAAFRVKYQADAQFRQKVEPYEDKLRSRKRDGFVAYLRFTDPAAFGESSDLYHYFLLDVDLEGCARTTRVAAAIFSLQLYVHRVLLRFEVGQTVIVEPTPTLKLEWEWCRHYRLWEANRRVALNPENYAMPSLRDDKTPLFKALEDALLQQDLTEQNVRNAFAGYLAGFDELANLRIAAACSQSIELASGEKRDILHLFGATSADPPAYYYQSIEGIQSAVGPADAGYSAWRPINVNIPAKSCSSIVFRGTLYLFWAEIVTEQRHVLEGGDSHFIGYRHRVGLRYSSLQLDGRWTPPQRLRIMQTAGIVDRIIVEDPLLKFSIPAVGSGGVIDLPAAGSAAGGGAGTGGSSTSTSSGFPTAQYDSLKRNHHDPIDDYTLTGADWETPYPIIRNNAISLAYGGIPYAVNLFEHTAIEGSQAWPDATSLGLLLIRDAARTVRGIGRGVFGLGTAVNEYHGSAVALREGVQDAARPLVVQPTDTMELVPINGYSDSCIMRIGEDSFYVRSDASGSVAWTCRLGSTLARAFGETLFNGNIESLLAIGYQVPLTERAAPFSVTGTSVAPSTLLDYRTAPGRYYREIFAHTPWVIAEHLHGEGQYAAAQRWFHFLFNPAGDRVPTPPDEYRRVWQFREFRAEPIRSLREALEDQGALDIYRRDPFNPHAIARLRPGAYERAVIMQYIDNLLDWGDSLFAQFTAESINEATMLYILAADILGPRAPDVGDCGEGMPSNVPKTYANIAPWLKPGHEFLIEAESQWNAALIEPRMSITGVLEAADGLSVSRSAATAAAGGPPGAPDGGNGETFAVPGLSQPYDWQRSGPTLWSGTRGTPVGDLQLGRELGRSGLRLFSGPGGIGTFTVTPDPLNPPEVGPPQLEDAITHFDHLHPGFELRDIVLDDVLKTKPLDVHPKPNVEPWKLLDTSIVFCVPDNVEFRAYWDRVEDRLNKIRTCRDLSGARRSLELFGPEIDPHLLIKMKAAGLSLEDVLSATSGSVPPYRFVYLLEKARQYARMVQDFGAVLLSALEKRDAEALNNLRTVHEQHLLKLRTRVQDLELSNAQSTLAGLQLQRDQQSYRRDYYLNLSRTGLIGPERMAQAAQASANEFNLTAAMLSGAAGIVSLLPQLGAPTAMKYGGVEIGNSLRSFSGLARDAASVAEIMAVAARAEGDHQRRDDEWKFQAAVAQREYDQLNRQVAAAEIRVSIAEQSLEVHNRTIEQTEEIFQFFQDRFTKAELYTVMSTRLRQLHRDAFNAAFSVATMAERAYRFERPEDTGAALPRGQWDPSTGGLLAGERLQLDLQSLERRYLETDDRRYEIEQSFSLAQFDPAALLALREQGECTFTVPELFFDLSYPGHYRRRIKAVRLSVPCVVGPFANVSATLRLLESRIRLDPDSTLDLVPNRHTVSIAASNGQSDTGVFEFNFRDERYMPFEGSGTVSRWQLLLPKAFRLFDYETIADAILRISYTALADEDLRDDVEALSAGVQRSILGIVRANDLQMLISLRRDLPDAFARLVRSAVNSGVPFEIDRRRLPWFIGDRPVTIQHSRVLIRTKGRVAAPTLGLTLNTTPVGTLTPDSRSNVVRNSAGQDENTLFTSAELVAAVGTWFDRMHSITLTSAGNVVAVAGSGLSIDTSAVLDVLIEVAYRVAP